MQTEIVIPQKLQAALDNQVPTFPVCDGDKYRIEGNGGILDLRDNSNWPADVKAYAYGGGNAVAVKSKEARDKAIENLQQVLIDCGIIEGEGLGVENCFRKVSAQREEVRNCPTGDAPRQPNGGGSLLELSSSRALALAVLLRKMTSRGQSAITVNSIAFSASASWSLKTFESWRQFRADYGNAQEAKHAC